MSKQKSSDECSNEKQDRETVDAFLARGGRIEQCEPEEAPPQLYGLDTEAVKSDTLSTAINPSHLTADAQRKARSGLGALANLPEYVAPLIFVAALSVYFLLSAP